MLQGALRPHPNLQRIIDEKLSAMMQGTNGSIAGSTTSNSTRAAAPPGLHDPAKGQTRHATTQGVPGQESFEFDRHF